MVRATLLLVSGLLLGCSSAQPLGAGQPCFQATECGAGLACIPINAARPDAGSVCSNDPSGVMGRPPAMGDGGMMMMEASADAPADGMMMMMDSAPPMDSSMMMPDMGPMLDAPLD